MKSRSTSRFLHCIPPLLALGATISYAQTTRTWDGGGTGGTNMDVAVNWSGDVVPGGGDTAQWDGTVPGALSLTYTAAGTPGSNLGAGNGLFLSVLGSQVDPLTITQASGTTAIRLQNITLASGSGAFTFGNADSITDAITLGSTSVTAHTFTNNSSNTASFGSDVRFAFGGGVAKTITFGGSGNWSFGGKFGNGGTGSVSSISKTGSGTLSIVSNIQGTNSGAALVNPGNVFVKAGTMVIESTGAVTTSNFNSVGQNGSDSGTLTLKGTFTSGNDFNVGDVGTSSGVLNIQDSGALTVNNGGFFVGSANTGGSTASGTVHHSSGTLSVTTTTDGRFILGGRNSAAGTGGSGTYNLSGTGTVTNAGNAFIGGYGTGTFVQSGGSFTNNGWIAIARQAGSTGSYSVSAGQLIQANAGAGLIVGELGTGTLNVSNTGSVAVATGSVFRVGNGAAAVGTVNLNGGTISAPKVETGGGASTFNFNGGTLRATGGSTTFFQGLTTTNVRDGGVTVDTNGNDITIGQALLHSSLGGDAAIDGGLKKINAGALTLSGTSTYTGATVVSAGTLLVNGSLGNSAVSVTAGTLGGTGTIGGSVSITGSSTLAAGTSIESLTTGALTMANGTTFAYEAADATSTGADLVAVNGALSLTGVTLDLTGANLAAATWAAGDKLTLISYTGPAITSGFSGYTDNATYLFGTNEWLFNYDDTTAGNNFAADSATGTSFVTLTVVPEPGSVLLGGLGLLAILRRRRK